jgi:hypothetical protein
MTKLKKLLEYKLWLFPLITASLIPFSMLYSNYTLNNKNSIMTYNWGGFQRVSRIDGFLDHTGFTRWWDSNGEITAEEATITRARGPTLRLTDGFNYGPCDGKVDRLEITSGIFPEEFQGTLLRKMDYTKFKSRFDEADKKLRETKERFAEELR